MLHLLFSTLFLSLPLFAQLDYSLCSKKLNDSHSIKNGTLALSVAKNSRLYFQSPPKNLKIVKSNHFLSLYLVEATDEFSYPFELKHSYKSLVLLEEESQKKIKVTKHQLGLNSFAQTNSVSKVIAPIVSKCCRVSALNTQFGVIEHAYLKRFLDTKEVKYSDIGIRIKQKNTQSVVVSVDPFHQMQFKKGDIVLSFDAHNVKSSASLMQEILFTPIGSTHTLKIKRGSKVKVVNATSYKRRGGGFISDTFLEHKGIYLTQSLKVKNLTKDAKKYYLKKEDKILQVNGYKVQTQEQIRRFISEYKDFVMLLIQRDGFQFFVKII